MTITLIAPKEDTPFPEVRRLSPPHVAIVLPWPPDKPHRRPICEATIKPQARAARPEGMHDGCTAPAAVSVNGRVLCRRHAENHVLNLLLEQ